MPKYVIEREVPGAGKLSAAELQGISQRSCAALEKLGTDIQWIHSYVTDDKIFCIYISKNEDLVKQHARIGEFPANRIHQIRAIIDPVTADANQPAVSR